MNSKTRDNGGKMATKGIRASGHERQFVLEGQPVRADPLAPGLYLVATPIGNLGDISLRALRTLAAADMVLCEDTRVTRKLTTHYGIAVSLKAYHDHNAARVRPSILAALAGGASVALVSDAGTPLVSDPGFKLVEAAVAAGAPVTAVPGASAVLAALSVAGLPSDRFLFAGFLPVREGARREALLEVKSVPATLIFYESPKRLGKSLAAMTAVLGVRAACVARELTKLHEESRRGNLDDLAEYYAAHVAPRGEVVVVVGPPGPPEPTTDADVDTLLAAALETMPVKVAAAAVAADTGRPRRELYARAVVLKQNGGAQK